MADQPPQAVTVGLSESTRGGFPFLIRVTVMCVTIEQSHNRRPRLYDRLMVAQITLVGPGRTKSYYARKKKSGFKFLQRASVTPIARGNSGSRALDCSAATGSFPPGPHQSLMWSLAQCTAPATHSGRHY